MDFIVADSKKIEQGFLNLSKTIDIDLGNTNDFEITLDLDEWSKTGYTYGYLIYANGAEYGGRIGDKKVDTKSNTIKLKGYTWRGMLSKKIIEPPTGIAYKTVSGEANAVMRNLIGSLFGDLFIVDSTDSGFAINYQFDRYCTMLDGFNKMLATVGARLKIYFDNADMYVHLCAVAIVDYSEELEYSQDNKINFTSRDYRCGINHLICLGSGELEARTVIHLYADVDGNISTIQTFTGLEERVDKFDYPNAEDIDSLTEKGKEKFADLLNYKELSMTIGEINAEIGDIVGGRERVTGMEMKKPIINKILKISGNKEFIAFKVGD